MTALIGHETIWQFLTHADATHQRAHAYAFLGPARVGKRHVANLFAQRLLCKGSATQALFASASADKPCRTCESCIAWDKRIHQDLVILEKPAEEHTISIEVMRAFLAKLHQSPMQSAHKVAIIDGAEHLTTAAANAFLKQLEEPSVSTTIILIIHDRRRLVPTILSRCQIIEFAPVWHKPDGGEQRLWEQARGLPGLYETYCQSPSLAQQDADEQDGIWQLVDMTAGQRLAFLETLFPKKKQDHAIIKQVWAQRFSAWQRGLRKAWTSGNSKRALAAVQLYDELELLRQGLHQNIHIRMHVERFCLMLDAL